MMFESLVFEPPGPGAVVQKEPPGVQKEPPGVPKEEDPPPCPLEESKDAEDGMPSTLAVPPTTDVEFETDPSGYDVGRPIDLKRRATHDAHAKELGIEVGTRFFKYFRMIDKSSKPFLGVVARPGKRTGTNRKGWLIHYEDDTWDFLTTWQVKNCIQRTATEHLDTSKSIVQHLPPMTNEFDEEHLDDDEDDMSEEEDLSSSRSGGLPTGVITKTSTNGWFTVRVGDDVRPYRSSQLRVNSESEALRIGATVEITSTILQDPTARYAEQEGVIESRPPGSGIQAPFWRKVRFDDGALHSFHTSTLRLLDDSGSFDIGKRVVVVPETERPRHKKMLLQQQLLREEEDDALGDDDDDDDDEDHHHHRKKKKKKHKLLPEEDDLVSKKKKKKQKKMRHKQQQQHVSRRRTKKYDEAPTPPEPVAPEEPATGTLKRKLPSKKKRKPTFECQVCHEVVDAADEGELLPCGHLVHLRCLNAHLLTPNRVSRKRSEGLADCPVCKTYFMPQKRHCMLDLGPHGGEGALPPRHSHLDVDYSFLERRQPSAKPNTVSGETIEFWQLQ